MNQEIKIIKQQLRKLKKQGICLDIVNDAICLVDIKKQTKAIEYYDNSNRKWDGLSKDIENYDIIDCEKYIITNL